MVSEISHSLVEITGVAVFILQLPWINSEGAIYFKTYSTSLPGKPHRVNTQLYLSVCLILKKSSAKVQRLEQVTKVHLFPLCPIFPCQRVTTQLEITIYSCFLQKIKSVLKTLNVKTKHLHRKRDSLRSQVEFCGIWVCNESPRNTFVRKDYAFSMEFYFSWTSVWLSGCSPSTVCSHLQLDSAVGQPYQNRFLPCYFETLQENHNYGYSEPVIDLSTVYWYMVGGEQIGVEDHQLCSCNPYRSLYASAVRCGIFSAPCITCCYSLIWPLYQHTNVKSRASPSSTPLSTMGYHSALIGTTKHYFQELCSHFKYKNAFP